MREGVERQGEARALHLLSSRVSRQRRSRYFCVCPDHDNRTAKKR